LEIENVMMFDQGRNMGVSSGCGSHLRSIADSPEVKNTDLNNLSPQVLNINTTSHA